MRITSKGQVTIPLEFRQRYGLLPDTEVEFLPGPNALKIRRSKVSGRGARLIEHMRGRGDGKLSTDQIMKLTRG